MTGDYTLGARGPQKDQGQRSPIYQGNSALRIYSHERLVGIALPGDTWLHTLRAPHYNIDHFLFCASSEGAYTKALCHSVCSF